MVILLFFVCVIKLVTRETNTKDQLFIIRLFNFKHQFCYSVQIWDLTAGKLLTELKLHRGPVNIVEFHPSDLLLASGSSDK